MRFIKLIFISVIVLFVLATLVGLLFPSKVLVSRAVNISSTTKNVQAIISNVSTWKYWIEGANDTTYSLVAANTIKLGNTLVTLDSVTNNKIYTTWQPSNNTVQKSIFQVIPANNTTILQWQFEQSVKWYPWERFSTLLSDKIIGTMMEKNLQLLSEYIQRNP